MQALRNEQFYFKPHTAIAIVAIHLAAIAVFFPYFFSWYGVGLCFFLIWISASLGVSLCYHRLLSHQSWQAHPALKHFLLICASIALQGGPITWSATHRLHHRESDHEEDPHSPLAGFLWSHLIWNFYGNKKLNSMEQLTKLAPDLARDPLLRFYEKNFAWVWVAQAVLAMAIGFVAAGGGMPGVQLALSLFVWGSLIRTVMVWNSTWFVNSVTHLFGYRNFETEDDSRNLWWVAILTFGEGWHNNHHALAGSPRFGQKWWEFDATWVALQAFQKMGLVKKLNKAPIMSASESHRNFTGKAGSTSARLPRSHERLAQILARRHDGSVEKLVRVLASRRQQYRLGAALALSSIDSGAHSAIDPLIKALSDRSDRVGDAAAKALVRIGDAARPALEHAVNGAAEAILRIRAERALSMMEVRD